ncbi:MAG: hypothetical protein H0T46_23430 [Deltaproteobacteria bacterium]|nr:hypothetical protein [Deltaproteobacteria bacterium]
MKRTILASFLLAAAATPAFAEDVATPAGAPVAASNPEPLPPPTGTPAPVAEPVVDDSSSTVIQHGMIPDDVIYGRKGTREAGASMGLMMSSKFRSVSLAPSYGFFIADNMRLTGILAVQSVKANNESAVTYSALVEPSYHMPVQDKIFGFLGMGVGVAYEEALGAGLAIAPRLGASFLIGDSGVLTPYLQYQYISHSEMSENDIETVAMRSAMTVNVGYTAIW